VIKCLQKYGYKAKKLAEGEIQKDEVPEIKTIEEWITRYSASLRK
jgi:hypothetical protein